MKKFTKRIWAIAYHAFIGMHERTNILIHELSHALAIRLFSKKNSQILIFMNPSNDQTPGTPAGFTTFSELDSPWKNTMIYAAGHMGEVAFEICTIAAMLGMKKHIPKSAYFLLGLRAIAGLSLVFLRIGKSFTDENGDFSKIEKHGTLPLAVTSSVLAGECIIASTLALSAYCQSVHEMAESIVAHLSKSSVPKT